MLKDAPPEEIAAAVRIVASGEALLAPAVTRAVIEEFARQRPPPSASQPPAVAELTPREHEVLDLLARGLSNPEICERARHQRGNGEDARRPHPPEARPPRPRPGRDLRLRDRPNHPRLWRRLSVEPDLAKVRLGLPLHAAASGQRRNAPLRVELPARVRLTRDRVGGRCCVAVSPSLPPSGSAGRRA